MYTWLEPSHRRSHEKNICRCTIAMTSSLQNDQIAAASALAKDELRIGPLTVRRENTAKNVVFHFSPPGKTVVCTTPKCAEVQDFLGTLSPSLPATSESAVMLFVQTQSSMMRLQHCF